MRPTVTNKRFSHSFTVCVLALAFVAITGGCKVFDRFKPKPQPAVIAVPDQMAPSKIEKDEPAPYDGWLFSKPLFNEYAPYWQKGPFGSGHELCL